MAFKYVNPGYAELLQNSAETTYDTNINKINGVAFGNVTDSKAVALPDGTNNVWIKCSVHRGHITGLISLTGYVFPTGVMINDRVGDCVTIWANEGSGGGKSFKSKYYYDGRLDLILHVKSEKNSSVIELWIDNELIGRRVDCINGKTFSGVWLDPGYNGGSGSSGSYKDAYFYNLIIADYDISREQVVEAALKAPTGTWKGIAVNRPEANEVGQVLTHTVDAEILETRIKGFSNTVKINGMNIAAIGTQYNADEVNALTATISLDGGKEISSTKKLFNTGSFIGDNYLQPLTLDEIKKAKFSLTAAKV